MNNFGLYVIITRPILSYTEIAEICVKEGVRMLQLREKHLSDREVLAAAAQITAVTRGTSTLFVMNDRADLALAASADVLHLGQDDIPIEEARKIVGRDMLIGLSTHSIAQAKEALSHKPDYIGFGPVYPTTTKQIADPTVGTELLKEVIGFSDVPVVAIGGIFPHNLKEVLATGAQNFSLVRHLMETTDTQQRIIELKSITSGCI